MNTSTPTTAPAPATPDAAPPAPPALVFFVAGMDTPARMASAMRALADLLPVEFPDPPASTGGILSVTVTSCEVTVLVMAPRFVDAAMTGKIVGVETHEVYHAGPNWPPTLHYAAWFPYLLPGQVRVKVVSCETLG